ncbi:DUF1700 domain-containing protein [Rugamonas sp.]|uniref:DUF1700 domain-containing protein n=1 Tax=Rugamonas sp. TaxID=1926287 RepID=UPI0025E2FE20|nr:DUF1700 domain-containing protein [Rugamonas sp.]
MNKLEYLDALKQAMSGLPPDTIAKTLAYYEQRFIDGVAAGRRENDVAAELDEPRKIAITLRANRHLSEFEQKRSPRNLLRMLMSLIGLAIFNLFMVIPAAVYAALLMTVYALAFSFYIAGVAVTASGLSGVNELVFEGPLHSLVDFDRDHDRSDDHDARMQTRLSIGDGSVRLHEETAPAGDAASDGKHVKLLQRAEAMGGGSLLISADDGNDARATQTAIGLAMVLAGILVALLSVVLTRYTVTAIKRYVAMNFSLLRGR